MSKTIVIYHRSDFDGIFCREIARRALPNAELIGMEYGDPLPVVAPEDNLYILDFSVPEFAAQNFPFSNCENQLSYSAQES